MNVLVLVPVAAVTAYPDYDITLVSLGAFAAAGLLGSLVARLCYFISIARIGSSRTEPLKALFPVVAAVTAILVLDEQVTTQLVAGIALIVGGSFTVVLEARNSPVTASGRQLWVDLLFPLTAAVLLGIDPIFTKLGLAEGTPAIVGVTIRIGAGAVGFGLYLAWRRGTRGDVPAVGLNRWLALASLANTAYLLAYYAALTRTPVTVVAPVLGTSTLLVVAGAALFLQDDERVTWRLAGAAVVVVAGIIAVVQA